MSWQILQGDCIEQMATLEEASIDAVVCDPPYGIGLMGHEWDQPGEHAAARAKGSGTAGFDRKVGDHRFTRERSGAMKAGEYDLSLTTNRRYQAWCEAWARECLRVLKPGGHLLASCGSRTYQRMACGIEDAGFEIRDSIMWLYAQGFPKSMNLDRDVRFCGCDGRRDAGNAQLHDLREGASPRPRSGEQLPDESGAMADQRLAQDGRGRADCDRCGLPIVPRGLGTALKPAHEPIVVARKPLSGTVAQTILEHGTGAINVDGCRIGDESTERKRTDDDFGLVNDDGWEPKPGTNGSPAGRWPANVLLDEHWEPILRLRDTLESDAWQLLSEWCNARNGQLPRVRGGNRRPAEPGESPEVLLQGVSGSLALEEPDGRRSPDEGAQTHPGGAGEDAGESQNRKGTGQPQLEGPVPEQGLRDDKPAGSPGDTGASASDGGGSRSPSSVRRGSPSRQRGQDGQSPGELGDPRDADPQDDSRRALSGVARASRPSREVLLRDVPDHWLRFFEFSGDVARIGAGAELDEQTGILTSGSGPLRRSADKFGRNTYGEFRGTDEVLPPGDSGGASRFFYCAKTSRAERNAGLQDFPDVEGGFRSETSGQHLTRRDGGDPGPTKNGHPTVKPINLMRWLCRLVTPPGGTILDPFTGSGSTGAAAVLEGFDFIGCEREADYVAIAEARIAFWAKYEGREVEDVLAAYGASERESKAHTERGQMSIADVLEDAA